jgi:hypothetical protein
MMGEAEAAVWARAYCFGQCRLEPFVPRGPIRNHDAAEFYFFSVAGAPYGDGEYHVIAVRKADGRISCCGVIGVRRTVSAS